MSTAALSGLRDYLYSTLSPSNMLWLGTQLTEYANRHKPYSQAELLERAESARERIAAGHYTTMENVLLKLEEDCRAEEMKMESA